ncbi:hypothetical protein LRS73_20040 [Methylobacterium currus]|uniref:hypothetical protein n=1 Tax=Methylobacterium currus TaxID=2051553 RepID=UPI001E4F2DC4|nr:hypothetical protein [Methylobacterium currus]UHC14814.1 hypothetical protein LRS73_20040 [Methylobacterium currus]
MAYFHHTIHGTVLDLAHPEPRRLAFVVRNLARELAIDVRFSYHRAFASTRRREGVRRISAGARSG